VRARGNRLLAGVREGAAQSPVEGVSEVASEPPFVSEQGEPEPVLLDLLEAVEVFDRIVIEAIPTRFIRTKRRYLRISS